MSRPILEVNQLVEIIVPEGESYAGKYKSRVEEVSGTYMKLAMPSKDGKLVPLRTGATIGIEQFTPSAIFVHHVVILKRVARPFPMVITSKAKTVTKIQRRSFLRWDVRLPIKYGLVRHDGKEVVFQRSFTRDLSGGGALIELREPAPKDGIFELELTLPKGPIRAIARVCRAFTKDQDGVKVHLAGVDFISIDERSRDKIINFIFEQQREMRKKGLI